MCASKRSLRLCPELMLKWRGCSSRHALVAVKERPLVRLISTPRTKCRRQRGHSRLEDGRYRSLRLAASRLPASLRRRRPRPSSPERWSTLRQPAPASLPIRRPCHSERRACSRRRQRIGPPLAACSLPRSSRTSRSSSPIRRNRRRPTSPNSSRRSPGPPQRRISSLPLRQQRATDRCRSRPRRISSAHSLLRMRPRALGGQPLLLRRW